MRAFGWLLLCALLAATPAQAHGIPIPDWLPTYRVSIRHNIPIPTRGPTENGVRDQTITAILYRPDRPGPMPGAVIVNSSGGIDGESELVWARYMAELGIATLVLDSFTPRNIRRTSLDQSLLDQFWSSVDGGNGWRWLAKQSLIDRDRILIHGMSRGGGAAIANAIREQKQQMRAEDVHFAAHIAISPGCGVHQRTAMSTGAPIFFMLGELDDYAVSRHCEDYAHRIQDAGNKQVRLAIYPGGFHAPELSWGSANPPVETGKRCKPIFRHPGGVAFDVPDAGRTIPANEVRDFVMANCLQYGGSVGGDIRLRRQMGADLLRFLMEHGFVRDEPMLAALPDCTSMPEGNGVRRSCRRAGWGWEADGGRVGSLLVSGEDGVPHDPDRGIKLVRIAAERGAPAAQTNLASWLRQGFHDLPRNPAEAQTWAERADAQGSGGGANELGWLAENRRDLQAAREHFRRAAERYNKFGMGHYGRYLAAGLGGPVDPAEAERWLRLAIHYENPSAHLFLARALEAGQLGRAPDPNAALATYREAAAAPAFPGQAEAAREVKRLEAALTPTSPIRPAPRPNPATADPATASKTPPPAPHITKASPPARH